MCSNYKSAAIGGIEAIVGEEIHGDIGADREVWPGYTSPIILRDAATGRMRVEEGVFGLAPHWAREAPRSTFNARVETVAHKPTFKTAWAHKNFALIPVAHYYEPYYASPDSRSVRWSISRDDMPTFCIAAIYWRPKGLGVTDGRVSFSMLTINATDSPELSRFHAPGKEKRAICQIMPEEYEAWLTATTELARVMLTLPEEARLVTAPAPRAPAAHRPVIADL